MCYLAVLTINCGVHKLLMMNTDFKHDLILKRKYRTLHDNSATEATGDCLGNQG
jgi:hypothetical protein